MKSGIVERAMAMVGNFEACGGIRQPPMVAYCGMGDGVLGVLLLCS